MTRVGVYILTTGAPVRIEAIHARRLPPRSEITVGQDYSQRLPATTTPAKRGELSEGTKALANAVLTAAAAKQLTDLRQQVTTLRSKVAELGSTLEQRDRILRRALVAMVDLFQYNENERQLAESERDRETAHHRQRTLLALQELLMHSRKKRKWW